MESKAHLLLRVEGRRWRTQVEFEDQCALRLYDYRGLFKVVDGTVQLTDAGKALVQKIEYNP